MLKYDTVEIIPLIEHQIQVAISGGYTHIVMDVSLNGSKTLEALQGYVASKGYSMNCINSVNVLGGTALYISGFNPEVTQKNLTEKAIRAKDAFSAWASKPNPEQLKEGLSLEEMTAAVKPTTDLTTIMQGIQTAISVNKPNVQLLLSNVSQIQRLKLIELGYTLAINLNNSTLLISGW